MTGTVITVSAIVMHFDYAGLNIMYFFPQMNTY